MRRLTRVLLNGLSALSALLFAASIVFWVRGYGRWDRLSGGIGLHTVVFESVKGEMAFKWETDASEEVTAAWRAGRGWVAGDPNHVGGLSASCRHGAAGFGYDAYDRVHLFAVRGGQASTRERIVVVPHWFLAGTCATFLTIRVVSARRRCRGNVGLCPNCGYDLRATPDRCPECGTIPAR